MIDDHLALFDERNVLLQLSLGLLSRCDDLDRLLTRHAARSRGQDGLQSLADPHGRALVEFVLGLIALRDSLRATLSTTPEPEPRRQSRVRGSSLMELLR